MNLRENFRRKIGCIVLLCCFAWLPLGCGETLETGTWELKTVAILGNTCTEEIPDLLPPIEVQLTRHPANYDEEVILAPKKQLPNYKCWLSAGQLDCNEVPAQNYLGEKHLISEFHSIQAKQTDSQHIVGTLTKKLICKGAACSLLPNTKFPCYVNYNLRLTKKDPSH